MIVVTGAAGFIGSNIVAALNAAGRSDLVLCDRLGTGDKWRNLAAATFADFVFPEEIGDWLRGRTDVEAVIHMGANSATTATDGDEIVESNFRFSLRLLDICAAQAIPYLYASSAAVYGEGEQAFEDDWSPDAVAALRPLNLYGWTKRQFDHVVADRMAKGGALPPQVAGFRFFNVFGPNEVDKGDMRSVVAKIFGPASGGETISLFASGREGIADGEQRRDFVYVKDVADAVLWFLANPAASGIFNIGTGEARSFRALAEAVFAALGREPRIAYVPMPAHLESKYQYYTQAPVGRLRAAGYDRPFTPLEEAVRDYVVNHLSVSGR